MPGGRILYSEARRVKLDGTRVVSSKLTNRKKVMNHLRSNKDIGKTKRARSRTHSGDRKASPTMMEERQEGCGCRTEERIPASGVVWKEAPESAIHLVLTGPSGVSPMALKDCASAV